MSAISTTGARIDRWDNGRPAHREHARLVEALKLERSSRYLYWAAFITFISEPHDEVPDLILAPYSRRVQKLGFIRQGEGQSRCGSHLRIAVAESCVLRRCHRLFHGRSLRFAVMAVHRRSRSRNPPAQSD